MRPLPGTSLAEQLKTHPVTTAKWVESLLEYEGPLLAVFRTQSPWFDDAGRLLLFLWTDVEPSDANRWLVVYIQEEDVTALKERRKTTLGCIMNSPDGYVYFVDFDGSPEPVRLSIAKFSDVPEEYLPEDVLLPKIDDEDDLLLPQKK